MKQHRALERRPLFTIGSVVIYLLIYLVYAGGTGDLASHIGKANALSRGGGHEMNIYQDAANQTQVEYAEQFSDRRLWTAVLLQALEDWRSSNMRLKSEA